MKQLVIGPRLNRDGVTIGGSEVLFENWLAYCDDNGHDYELIDGNKFNYSNKGVAMLSIIWQIFKKARRCDVLFLHGSKNDYLFISPFMALAAMIYGKPFYMKKFGGDFHNDYEKIAGCMRIGVNWAMKRAAGLYWELKKQLEFGRRFNRNSMWCPNTRKANACRRDVDKPYGRRFVFMSHVRKEKGVDEMLEAFRRLGSEYKLDIYGTLMGYVPEQLDGRYKGVVEAEQVPTVLSEYDCMILPSWREGYPGIIIEAFGCGLPVLASNIGGIPEMLTDGKNGVMCEAHDVDSLVAAVRRIDKVNYGEMSANALKSFDIYDGDKVNAGIIAELESSITK